MGMSIFNEAEDRQAELPPDNFELDGMRQRIKRGANWFFWIAALSMINSVVLLAGGSLNFIIGLGVTQVIYAVLHVITHQSGGANAFTAVVLLLDVLVAGVFALCGFFAGKGYVAVFITGIVLYVLDALLYLLFGDFLAAGFHGLALFYMIRGVMATFELRAATKNAPMMQT
jgi:hypothetical protein